MNVNIKTVAMFVVPAIVLLIGVIIGKGIQNEPQTPEQLVGLWKVSIEESKLASLINLKDRKDLTPVEKAGSTG